MVYVASINESSCTNCWFRINLEAFLRLFDWMKGVYWCFWNGFWFQKLVWQGISNNLFLDRLWWFVVTSRWQVGWKCFGWCLKVVYGCLGGQGAGLGAAATR